MRKWFTITRLLVGAGIAAIGVVVGLAIGFAGDDDGSRATGVSEELSAAAPEGDDAAAPTLDDLGFGAGLGTADLAGSLRAVVTASNGVARLQDASLDALDAGFTRLAAGDGPGAEAAFDQQAGGLIEAMDRAVAAEKQAQDRARTQLDGLAALLDEADGALDDLRPVEEQGRLALRATEGLVAFDEDVATRVGSMRAALLENRVPRYRQQAFDLVGVLADAEVAGTTVNERLNEFAAVVEEASAVLAEFGADRALTAEE